MIEDDFKNLRLLVPADGPRDRVLAAAVAARRDQRIGRWIRGVAAAAISIALISVAVDETAEPSRKTSESERDMRLGFTFPDESGQERP